MPQIISATQAKNQFSEIVNRVLYSGEEFVVQKQGRPVVKITSTVDKNISQPTKKPIDPGLKFLLKLATYKAKGLPKDMSKNLDKYAWD